jgi:hypothetical protein
MSLLDFLNFRLGSPHRSLRRVSSASLGIELFETRLLLTAPTMSDSEQYMLELINRARANPSAEASRYGIGLNDGVASQDTISTAPKQPLAPQQGLITAAVLHSDDMLNRDYFSHTTQGAGTTFSQRVTNQGYIWSLVAENIGYAAKTVSATQTTYINEVHEGLIKSSGHRENIMLTALEEAGIGARLGAFQPPGNPTTFQFTEMVTVDFGSRNLNPFITGVAYTDADNNNFYTIGESIRSGTVTAVDVATGAVFSDTVGVSGAYGFTVPAGTYIISATLSLNGSSQTYQYPGSVVVGTDNVKVDFETNSGTLVPSSLELTSTASSLNENGTTTTTQFTLTRTGSTASDLSVNITSSDTSEATVPSLIVIPAGHFFATFTASAFNDGVIDGNQTATITASTSGFPSANLALTVVDRTYPVLPTEIQTVATSRPVFTWTSVSNAATYEIWLNNITTGESSVLNTANIATTTYAPVVDLPIGTYGVWVRGFTSGGLAGAWSPMAAWKLRPTTTVQGSGRTEASSNFTISWTPLSGASAYDVWIDRQTSSTSQYLRDSDVSTNSLEVSGFDIGRYKVWVRARNSAGDYTGWSPAAIIDVNYAPTTISVTAASLSATATLNWSPVAGAVLYDVWINNLTTGTSAAIRNTSVSGTSLELTTASPASYRAWVRARDLNGGSYVWSNSFDLEIGRTSRMISPTGTGQPARPVFSWTTVAGAVRYEIWLTDLSTGFRVNARSDLTGTSYTNEADLQSGRSYRVWIRGFDSAGTSSVWSQPLTFTIASTSAALLDLELLSKSAEAPARELVFASADEWLYAPVNVDPVVSVGERHTSRNS